MRIVLPKPSRQWKFDRLFIVELNDFDVERLLPTLFYLIITRGRERGARRNDPKDFDAFLDRLLRHGRLKGFDQPETRRTMERWLRAAIVRMGRTGRGKKGEQIEFPLPWTLLTYKSGLPTEISRQRKVHVFVYQLLTEAMGEAYGGSGEAQLEQLIKRAFGRGASIGAPPKYDGQYDGKTELDVHILLSMLYLDGFELSGVGKKATAEVSDPALPSLAKSMARDLLRFIIAYERRMPVLGLTRGLVTLLNLELFTYTLKMFYAVNSLVSTHALPLAMSDGTPMSPPEVYVDFTRERGSVSDELARACVDRDLEELRLFFESSLLLRTIHRFLEFIPELQSQLKGLSTPEYLRRLDSLRMHPGVLARAQAELEGIRHETLDACQNDTERKVAEEYFAKEIQGGDAFTVALKLLAEAGKKNNVRNTTQWFWSVGGLRKDYGLLAGNTTGRRNWRYAPSDDLLATLVRLAMIEDPGGDLKHITTRSTLPLSDFLEFLERKFGFIVARPPAFLDDVTARTAATRNLEALKRRLRQMGFFRDLSDDFNAQYLHMQMAEEDRV